jgi:hypothetical protein
MLALALFVALPPAQANVVPGLDVRLSAMRSIGLMGRSGTFPNGLNGISFDTTVCNEGTVEVPWFQPMNLRHPKIAFLIAAERDGRLVQLSGASYVKHGFFAANAPGCGTSCQRPGGNPGEFLGLGCSDTYAISNNGDNFYLGPAEEIDPWFGTWERTCSLFDRGFPDVGAPENCDGRRSLTRTDAAALGPTHSRVEVSDEDLIVGGPLFFQGHYVVEGQAEDTRDDNLGSRPFSASWNGSLRDLTPTGQLLPGSVLERWSGALVTSATDGGLDGRVYAGARVSGPVEGFYRYEYALHNRDHARGIGGLRIPLCVGARVRAFGFRDIDRDPLDDWSATLRNGELVFTQRGRPLTWNTIYNFWFECDAAPVDAALTLEAGLSPARQTTFTLPSRAPLGLYSVYRGPGCARGQAPTLFPVGTPARATLGNASFGLSSAGNAPLEANFLHVSPTPGAFTLRGCTVWLGARNVLGSVVMSDASGLAAHLLPIPNDLALEGRTFAFQAAGRRPAGGVLFGDYELSDGILVRLGNTLSDCP